MSGSDFDFRKVLFIRSVGAVFGPGFFFHPRHELEILFAQKVPQPCSQRTKEFPLSWILEIAT